MLKDQPSVKVFSSQPENNFLAILLQDEAFLLTFIFFLFPLEMTVENSSSLGSFLVFIHIISPKVREQLEMLLNLNKPKI